MTTTPDVRVLDAAAAASVARLLEGGFRGVPSTAAVLTNQYLLAALDRGEHSRFSLWPGDDPVAVLYTGTNGTLVPAGAPEAGPAFAEPAERSGWRVLVGDAPISLALLDAYPRGLFRRRPAAREQRFMVLEAGALSAESAAAAPPRGFRRAERRDLERLTDLAARLHVEDLMGPPIARAGRVAVRERMLDSVLRGDTWVVERDGEVVAKVDLSLRSRRRGAQIAGVYVDDRWRGQGIAGAAVAAVARGLIAEGLPGVTLHVRADNAPAIAAYRRAGFEDRGAWTLALR